MQDFIVHVAHDVPHYSQIKVTARDADHALEIIKGKPLEDVLEDAVHDHNWDFSVNARIVFIADVIGEGASHEDIRLRPDPLRDALRALIDASDALTAAIEGTTDQFDDEKGALMDATSAAEKVLNGGAI
jgi:hypothetical protein